MKLPNLKSDNSKSLLVQVLQWLYLIVSIAAIIFIFSFEKISFITNLGFPKELFIGLGITLTVYCLVLSLSFFTQNTNLLILSLVLIFFTTIASITMLVIALPNAKFVIAGHLPSCSHDLATCSLKDGIVVSSALLLAGAIPALILNILTIIGSVKAIASGN